MNDFQRYYHDCLHRVSIAPGVARTNELAYSDIVLHLPYLQYLASLCWHVTEFGTREGHSTMALLSGCNGEVHSWDIEKTSGALFLSRHQDQLPCRWVFGQGDTGDPNLPVQETDLLFLDTEHTYRHLRRELSAHGRKARRFLVFHDTRTCGAQDLSGNDPQAPGILRAIEEFITLFPGEYRTHYRTEHNNGLWSLERVTPLKKKVFLP